MALRYVSPNLPKPELWVPRKKVLDSPELQRYELQLCRKYPMFYYLRWVITKDEVTGNEMLFPNFAHLHRISDLIEQEDRLAIEKSRRMQLTWIGSAKISHNALFKDNSRSAVQSFKYDSAKFIVKDRIQFIMKKLPPFFFRGFKFMQKREYLEGEIVTPWGSYVQSFPDSEEGIQAIGLTLTHWMCDEARAQPHLDKSLTGILPTLSGGGKAMILSSTAPGIFHDLCDDVAETNGKPSGKTDERHTFVGFDEHRNMANEFYVVRLNYDADPAKDRNTPEGQAWQKLERKGMSDSQWNQEYEIDASAMASTLVYPQFDPKIHVVDWEISDIPKDWTRYCRMDPGIGAPTALLWFAVSPKGAVYFYDEYYHPGRDIKANADQIKDQEKAHPGEPFCRKADPHAFKRQYNGLTCAGMYSDEGLYFGKANNDLDVGIEAVRLYLENAKRDDANPMRCYFLPHLQNLFKEMRRYVFPEKGGDVPVKKDDHLMDCLRYSLVDYPAYINPRYTGRVKSYRDPLTGASFEYESDEED